MPATGKQPHSCNDGKGPVTGKLDPTCRRCSQIILQQRSSAA